MFKRINPNLEQMNKILINRANIIPKELYKYRSLSNDETIEENRNFNALKEDKIYLSHPFKFNDPYDSAFSIDVDIFKENIIKNAEQRIKEKLIQNKFKEIGIDINLVKNIDLVYNDMNINMNIMYSLLDKELPIFYEELIKQQIKFKVSCFSETSNSILMWSHYANEHQGFCIDMIPQKLKIKLEKNFFLYFTMKLFSHLLKLKTI